MKTGLTIKEMAQELLRQSKAKQDYPACRHHFIFIAPRSSAL